MRAAARSIKIEYYFFDKLTGTPRGVPVFGVYVIEIRGKYTKAAPKSGLLTV